MNVNASLPTNQKSDSAVQKGELYQNTFSQVLTGLLISLQQHQGKLEAVTTTEIAENGNINPMTMELYFNRVKNIMNEVVSKIMEILAHSTDNESEEDVYVVTHSLLKSLGTQPLMIDVLISTNNQIIWKNNLKPLALKLLPELNNLTDDLFNEIYAVFCYQFQCVLKRWSASGFSDDVLPETAYHLLTWANANNFFIAHICI